MGERAVGSILSAYDNDGSKGFKHIKTHGGKIFAQDMTAEINQMPFNDQASGCVDFILPINKIPGKLKSLAASFKN